MKDSSRPISENSVGSSLATALSRKSVRRFTAIELLAALTAWLVSFPFVMELRHGDLIEAVIATVVLFSSVLAVGGRRRTLVLAIVLVTPAFAGKWINHWRPDLMPPEVFTTAAIVFVAFIIGHLLSFILSAPLVTEEVVCAAISGYLLLGVVWAFGYILVAEMVPGSFVLGGGQDSRCSMTSFEAVYFSFVTLSTIGYGDMTPASRVAKMLAITEATAGMFYMTILISRLVAVYSRTPRIGARRSE